MMGRRVLLACVLAATLGAWFAPAAGAAAADSPDLCEQRNSVGFRYAATAAPCLFSRSATPIKSAPITIA